MIDKEIIVTKVVGDIFKVEPNSRYFFRGKAKQTNKWVYGYVFVDKYGAYFIRDIEGYIEDMVIPETVGQYTGLKDKNGKEIYGGDIVQYAQFTYIVYFGTHNVNPTNCVKAYQVGWYLKINTCTLQTLEKFKGQIEPLYDINGYMSKFPAHCAESEESISTFYIEKIGNIHDNPELLEVK